MSNNIQEDLDLFNELIAVFLDDELRNPVTPYVDPNNVQDLLDIKLEREGLSSSKFKQAVKKLILKTPKSSSKLFFNQLFGGRHSKAVLGDLLAVILNNSMATYKISGPQVPFTESFLFSL